MLNTTYKLRRLRKLLPSLAAAGLLLLGTQAGFVVRVVLVEGSDLWRIRSGRFVQDDDVGRLGEQTRQQDTVAFASG